LILKYVFSIVFSLKLGKKVERKTFASSFTFTDYLKQHLVLLVLEPQWSSRLEKLRLSNFKQSQNDWYFDLRNNLKYSSKHILKIDILACLSFINPIFLVFQVLSFSEISYQLLAWLKFPVFNNLKGTFFSYDCFLGRSIFSLLAEIFSYTVQRYVCRYLGTSQI
jgi:hypothetical protein